MMESIKYPMFNIDYPDWNVKLLGDLFLFNDIYSYKEDFFVEYYLEQKFVDCDGNLWKVLGKTPLKLSLPFYKRFKIEFLRLDENISLNVLKENLLKKSSNVEDRVARNFLRSVFVNASSIEGLLKGWSSPNRPHLQ